MEAETIKYFNDLWNLNFSKLQNGEVKAAEMLYGLPVPLDFCLSTVARLTDQKTVPIVAIEKAKDYLREATPKQFFYPLDSMHLSLLGCTPRYPNKAIFTEEKINQIFNLCSETLANRESVKMLLNGIGIVGNQVFIRVFPDNNKWAEMRLDLENALIKKGESPISYSNKAPIHINIMRIINNEPQELLKIEEALQTLREVELGEIIVDTIDFILTDFVLSTSNTKSFGKLYLKG